MKQLFMIEDTKSPIRTISYSPNGVSLAVGAEPNTLEVYSTPDYKRKANLKKHSGPVNHIDWSTDSHYLQTNSESQELLYFNAQDKDYNHIIELKQNIRNEPWATHNCIYTWSTQGIWKDTMKKGTEINGADRSNTKWYKEYQILATGDDNSNISLYKLPCVQPHAEGVVARGHSSFISDIKWSQDDSYLVSIGGEDQTIIVWKVIKSSN